MKKKYLFIAAVVIFVVLMTFSVAESAFLFSSLDNPPENFWKYYGEGLKTSIFLILAIWLVFVMFSYIFLERLLRAVGDMADSPAALKRMTRDSSLAVIAKKIRRLSGLGEDGQPDCSSQIGLALNGIKQGIIFLSTASEITFCNARAAEILGDRELGFDEILLGKQNAIAHADIAGREYEFAFTFLRDESAIVLITDLSELEELRRAREGLLNAVSSEFIAPLAAISSYAGLIRGGMTEKNVRDAAAVIESESKRISGYVKSLLADSGSKIRK